VQLEAIKSVLFRVANTADLGARAVGAGAGRPG
jgi:hypothetical protein